LDYKLKASHSENHLLDRIGWLRAAVLGANDGIISIASLLVGVAAASGDKAQLLIAGSAGLVAGALAMAAGEYVSVASQADTEAADIARERSELLEFPEAELAELTNIYVARGVEAELARKVAEQMTAKDALEAHLRDELGLAEHAAARPIQAAIASAISFLVGASIPLITAIVAPVSMIAVLISVISLVGLAGLGALGAAAGGVSPLRPMFRVAFWGALAMFATAMIGKYVGIAV
jgi:vacuolar iron transporter family protein